MDIIEKLEKIYDDALRQYGTMVDLIKSYQMTRQREIERVLDGLLDFCDDDRHALLYRDLCRFLFPIYPELTVEHIRLFHDYYGLEGPTHEERLVELSKDNIIVLTVEIDYDLMTRAAAIYNRQGYTTEQVIQMLLLETVKRGEPPFPLTETEDGGKSE